MRKCHVVGVHIRVYNREQGSRVRLAQPVSPLYRASICIWAWRGAIVVMAALN
jgi:hypothetical protein